MNGTDASADTQVDELSLAELVDLVPICDGPQFWDHAPHREERAAVWAAFGRCPNAECSRRSVVLVCGDCADFVKRPDNMMRCTACRHRDVRCNFWVKIERL